jgi:hypothetical protein
MPNHRPTTDPRVAADARRAQTDTSLDALRTPGRRRLVVLVCLALIAVAVATAWGGSAVWTLVALAPAIGAVWLVRRLVRLMADLPDDLVDERVRAVRNQRYVEAYRLLSAITVAVLLVVFIGADAVRIDWVLEARHVHAMFWLVMLMSFALPSMLLAWSEREI